MAEVKATQGTPIKSKVEGVTTRAMFIVTRTRLFCGVVCNVIF